MVFSVIKKILDYNEKEVRRLSKIVESVNALEAQYKAFDCKPEEFKKLTEDFKKRVQDGESLDSILPEAFAAVRQASLCFIGLRHFDVQLMGGIALHEGKIAEMKTGEGKTLVATLPMYLNALTGKGCHLVTVNDYLAKRDAMWMGPIFLNLGLSVGVIQHGRQMESHRLVLQEDGKAGIEECERQEAYACDITYGTNNEFGFDYLRDNMVSSLDEMSQKELHYAIVDEVDSILIDEARTPLIISGMADKPTDLYYKFARIIPRLKAEEDFTVDEKAHSASFTEQGIAKVEREIGVGNITDPENVTLFHHANCALRAQTLMKRDVDYVVETGQVVIVDEFTGRKMYGRRYSEGLHQAIEAKEGVKIEHESQTLATITFQNYFRLYEKLAGMTGTAKTEEQEFRKIYGLDVIVIPTHRPMVRGDLSDVVYKTEEAKFHAIVDEIVECHKRGQPVLVGTRSIEKSEKVSNMLHKRGIVRIDWKKYPEEKLEELSNVHFILNAKEHENEAKIIARSGKRGAITIATNMAGRGVDILLENGVADVGGLHIIGTERHESRRIDNQLRGRSGRQGDQGSSRFYVCLEDELMRLFGGDTVKNVMERFGFDDSTPIEHSWVTKSIENAQKKVENHHFEIRKHVLDYDDVMETQRSVIYGERRKILEGADLHATLLDMMRKSIEGIVDTFVNEQEPPETWNMPALVQNFLQLVPFTRDLADAIEHVVPEEQKETFAALTEVLKAGFRGDQLLQKTKDEIKNYLLTLTESVYGLRELQLTPEAMRELERRVMLHVIDEKWIEHLDAMDYLKEGINLRAYGQIDPLIAYKKEAFDMFDSLKASIEEDTVKLLFRAQAVRIEENLYHPQRMVHGEEQDAPKSSAPSSPPPARQAAKEKVGRNEPCPCGSGKKYKKCCGKS